MRAGFFIRFLGEENLSAVSAVKEAPTGSILTIVSLSLVHKTCWSGRVATNAALPATGLKSLGDAQHDHAQEPKRKERDPH